MTCHRDKVAKLDRSGHMPVREGKMECSSCHNPHGSTNVRLLKTGNSINEACASCHAEKRGPFLFEHAGVSGDSCATCHDPHGSNNDRMLVAKLPFLCQRCHNHTRHPVDDLRQQGGAEQQPAVQPQLRDLSLGDPRIEPSGRIDIPAAVTEATMRTTYVLTAAFSWVSRQPRCAQDPPSLPRADRSGRDRPQRVLRQAGTARSTSAPAPPTSSGDEARFQRYRDLRSGVYATSGVAGRRTQDWTFEAQAWNIGYRDQRYQLDVQRVGRLTGTFLWDQIPLWISGDTRTLYTETQPGVFRLEDSMQQAIQAGQATLHAYEDQAVQFDMRTMRKIGQADVMFNATQSSDRHAAVQEHDARGQHPVRRDVRFQQRGRDSGAGRHPHHRFPHRLRVGESRTACCVWAGTAPPSKTSSTASFGTTRCASARTRPARRRRAAWRRWPDNTLTYLHGTGAVALPMPGG